MIFPPEITSFRALIDGVLLNNHSDLKKEKIEDCFSDALQKNEILIVDKVHKTHLSILDLARSLETEIPNMSSGEKQMIFKDGLIKS